MNHIRNKMNINDMRIICQKPREWCDTWHGRVISRRISIYITWLLLKMNISPNIATLLFLFSIIAPCIFLGIGSTSGIFIGTLFLQLWYVLDHVDGEIARYRNLTSITGIYFDSAVHYIAHPIVFLSLGYGLARRYDASYIYLYASSAAISTILIDLMADLKKAVLFDAGKIKTLGSVDKRMKKKFLLIRRIFSAIHNTCTFPHIMNILTLAAILEIFSRVSFVLYLLIYAGIAMPVIWICKIALTIKERQLD